MTLPILTREAVGAALRQVRYAAGLTQQHVARTAGIRPDRLSRIERGLSGASPDMAERLAQTMAVDLDELARLAAIHQQHRERHPREPQPQQRAMS
jgi:transcriptional regulator with XRE-family HTH domain